MNGGIIGCTTVPLHPKGENNEYVMTMHIYVVVCAQVSCKMGPALLFLARILDLEEPSITTGATGIGSPATSLGFSLAATLRVWHNAW